MQIFPPFLHQHGHQTDRYDVKDRLIRVAELKAKNVIVGLISSGQDLETFMLSRADVPAGSNCYVPTTIAASAAGQPAREAWLDAKALSLSL